MSLGNIIGNMLNQGMSSQSHNRLRAGAENAERSGGIEQMLGSLMRGSGESGTSGSGDLAQRARDSVLRLGQRVEVAHAEDRE